MLRGGWGERKRESTGHDGKGKERREAPFPSSHRPPRAFFLIYFFFFSIIAIFFRDTQLEPLRRREPLIHTQISSGDDYFIRQVERRRLTARGDLLC